MNSSISNPDQVDHASLNVLTQFNQVFDTLISQYIASSTKDNQGLLTHFEEDWQSPCISISNECSDSLEQDALVNWLPYLRESSARRSLPSDISIDLCNLEAALEIKLPIQLHALFCRYFSHDINASAEQGGLTLIQAWNDEDFDRLQKNLIAHVLMKRRLKQADTLFFALTDEEDLLLSILLETGEVVLEVVGKEPHKMISPNLTDFMASLRPKPVLVSL